MLPSQALLLLCHLDKTDNDLVIIIIKVSSLYHNSYHGAYRFHLPLPRLTNMRKERD